MKLASFVLAVLVLGPLELVVAAVRGGATRRLGGSSDSGSNDLRESSDRYDGKTSGTNKSRSKSKSKSKRNMQTMTKKEYFYGDIVPFGNGVLYTISLLVDQEPARVGVAFSASSLTSLPTTPSDGRRDILNATGETVIPLAGHEFPVAFPQEALDIVSPLEHTVVNWNPDGHPPPTIYMIPHLDFHFYTYSVEHRETCVKTPPLDDMCPIGEPPFFANVDCAGLGFLTEPIPDDMAPPGYILVAGPAEAAMGNHLIPVTSAEFTGGEFTHTWIYGAEGGNITFFEPMVSVAYLEWLVQVANGDIIDPQDPNKGIIAVSNDGYVEVKVDIIVPEAYAEAGMYPTGYAMTYDLKKDEYTVSMTGFAYFPQGNNVKNIPCPDGGDMV